MTSDNTWQPTASLSLIKKRAALLQQIREFMRTRKIIEVDTPILSHFGISDPYIESMTTNSASEKDVPLYLHTSPEFCMKRLLAAGSEDIYQIAHVFRNEEVGKRHNTEFTMLEWYRVGFDYHRLMDEVGELLVDIGLEMPDKITYTESFMKTVDMDPHSADVNQLQNLCRQYGWDASLDDRHALLDFVFSEIVLKKINFNKPVIIYDYPACMSALATIKEGDPEVSERFELFVDGMEIANGFNELTNADEQLDRFESDLKRRKDKKLVELPIDNKITLKLLIRWPIKRLRTGFPLLPQLIRSDYLSRAYDPAFLWPTWM